MEIWKEGRIYEWKDGWQEGRKNIKEIKKVERQCREEGRQRRKNGRT
jgi:hypothetical protein